ncbi:MAG: phosphodiesterase/alkaline phosphatase D-like protein [Candidatus Azotimanducaceae bacterium]|jgi:phosphodiesterase/alkaline phosphatase D-like protein
MKITLGPLLGLEANHSYTVCFLSNKKVRKSALAVRLLAPHSEDAWQCQYVSCTSLRDHYFYRFAFDVPKQDAASCVQYELILDGALLADRHNRNHWSFEVPGQTEMPRISFTSCNGDSKNHPSKMPKKSFKLWKQMRKTHANPEERFHLMIMGGDQIYADSVWDKVSTIDVMKVKSTLTTAVVEKTKFDLKTSKKLTDQLNEFYENLYISSWSDEDMSFMLASVPSVMMWDDHDIVDGWGSYESELQNSDLFQHICPVAKKYFEIFQTRTAANTSRFAIEHFSMQLSFRNIEIIMLDNRTFRTSDRVMAPAQYKDLKKVLKGDLFSEIPEQISTERVLCFVVPVPLAHLNYSKLVEKALSKFSKTNFRKSMNDDALDHWDHANHKEEQKQLLDVMFDAGEKHAAKYVCVISGDVHTAGAATITKSQSRRKITQLISSAIVHKGPNKWQLALMKLVSSGKSQIPGYSLELKNFGSYKKHTINLRNFGIMGKAKHSGVVASLELENRTNLAHRTLNKFKN